MSSMNTAAQGRHNGLPLSSYSEPLVVVAQNFIVLLMLWKLKGQDPKEPAVPYY